MTTMANLNNALKVLPSDEGLELPAKTAACKRRGRSNRQLAAAAGISERHFYRLMKEGRTDTAGGERLYEQMVGGTAIAQILTHMGHKDLVGTDTHAFLDRFVRTLTARLAELRTELPEAIELTLAEVAATHSVSRLKDWYLSEEGIRLTTRATPKAHWSSPPSEKAMGHAMVDVAASDGLERILGVR